MKDYIETVELFPRINRELIALLRGLSKEDFRKPTQFPEWDVKDICAHLLDTSIRRLSAQRDGHQPREKPVIQTHEDLVAYVTRLADRWALAFDGVSPEILIKLIDQSQQELYEFLRTLDPFAKAFFAVNWAGERESRNWFDIAREYTERWHHQMQIREALNAKRIYQDELYYPVLDTFMRALPHHYRDWKMDRGYVLRVGIRDKPKWNWYLEWNGVIELTKEAKRTPNTAVTVDQDKAWKILTRWNDPDPYKVGVTGDKDLGEHFLKMNCLLIKS